MWPKPDSCIDPNFVWGEPIMQFSKVPGAWGRAHVQLWGRREERPVYNGAREQATASHHLKFQSQPGS